MISNYPYGASYSPLVFSETDWEIDLNLMKSAGMNLVRIGDVHGSWDRIEPRPGEIHFDRLDRFYRLAQKFGIHVLLCTGAASPPLWLAEKYPDMPILSNRGERYPLGASYHWACVNHPGYRSAAACYLERLAKFAASQVNHFGWQISNEIGFPFMPAREQSELGLYCYCRYCQIGFRKWLEEKYKTVNSLTEAWSWGTTNFVYNKWEDIQAPESPPNSWSGVTRWLDWRLFMQSVFTDFTGWQHGVIRGIDPDHPTSVNIFNFKGFDRFGTFMGLDQWQIAERTDHIGYDLYPGSGDKLKSRPEHISIFLDHGRSVANTVGRDFWAHEVESGPIGGWVMGPDHDTDEMDVTNYVIECLGHDVKLILYMPWREWDYQPLRWGALVDLDGNPTPQYEAAKSLGEFIQDRAEFFHNARVPQAEAAILESKPNAIFFRGVNQEEMLFAAQRGAYQAFWEQGFGVDFVSTHKLSLDRLAKYKFVCLPMMGLLSEQQAEILAAYASQGGILLGFARCGTLDERGWYHHQVPIKGLKEVFGIESLHAGSTDGTTIAWHDKTFAAHVNRDLLTVNRDTKVLASFSDGFPGVTVNRYGKGRGIFLATQADSGNTRSGEKLLHLVVKESAVQAGIQPALAFTPDIPRANGIDPHILDDGEGHSLVLFSNYSLKAISSKFRVASNLRKIVKINQVYPHEIGIKNFTEGKTVEFPLEFKPKEVKVIELFWKSL